MMVLQYISTSYFYKSAAAVFLRYRSCVIAADTRQQKGRTHTGPLKIIPTLYRLFKKKVTAGSNYMPAVQSVSDLIFR
ncbi:MAG: hypothetical protein II242_04545, partial [Peptococcaceae bacterium]|nr:hypothetical protein [Peptococcaceae bacterium]